MGFVGVLAKGKFGMAGVTLEGPVGRVAAVRG